MDRLEKLWRGVRGNEWHPPDRMLVLDPGDTTGWSLFVGGIRGDSGQIVSSLDALTSLIDIIEPTLVVYERYVLYPWASEAQTFSDFPTVRLIGALELLCHQRGLATMSQTAQQAKGFVGDERLKELHIYNTNQRHANDATRHGVYALIANKSLPEGTPPEEYTS